METSYRLREKKAAHERQSVVTCIINGSLWWPCFFMGTLISSGVFISPTAVDHKIALYCA